MSNLSIKLHSLWGCKLVTISNNFLPVPTKKRKREYEYDSASESGDERAPPGENNG